MKILRAKYPYKCVGCELCIMEAQQQQQKTGLEDAPIRIFRKENGKSFEVVLDPSVNKLNINKIKEICPKQVFEIEEVEEIPTNDLTE